MQIEKLHKHFDRLQRKYGDKNLHAIYGAGCTNKSNVLFVFMNPTGKNPSAQKRWQGIRAPWIGTKNTWGLLTKLGLFSAELLAEIKDKKGDKWDADFAQKVYGNVKKHKIYITNLSKATQVDARALKNSDFLEYVDLLKEEIDAVKPKIVITFGNQVSSLLLGTPIAVTKTRKQAFSLETTHGTYQTFAVHYPVGQGMRNIHKSIEDITWIMKKYL